MRSQILINPQVLADRGFKFTGQARRFPVVDARPLRWPKNAALGAELVKDWKERAGRELAAHRLSKATMTSIASHISRKDGTCPLSDRQLSGRSGRSVPSTKRDITRLKKLGFLIAEVDAEDGYLKRRRLLILAIPDRLDEDQRIPPFNTPGWGSTYPPYVDPTDIGERRDV